MDKNHLLGMNSSIKLNQVTKNDTLFLYDLLKNKDPNANISHKKMPSYDEHVKFVMSKPYTNWYIIEYEKKMWVQFTCQNKMKLEYLLTMIMNMTRLLNPR